MIRIVITAEQGSQFDQSNEPVEIVDEHGNPLGYFAQPFSQADILEARRRSAASGGGRTTAEVLNRLADLTGR